MSEFVEKLRALILAGDVRISEHGYDELAEDGLSAREILGGIEGALIVEEYPDYPKGPCALLLQKDQAASSIHVVWGIPKEQLDRRFWSLPIDRIRTAGIIHSHGGCNNETTKEGKICT